jgi:hypothetical protein
MEPQLRAECPPDGRTLGGTDAPVDDPSAKLRWLAMRSVDNADPSCTENIAVIASVQGGGVGSCVIESPLGADGPRSARSRRCLLRSLIVGESFVAVGCLDLADDPLSDAAQFSVLTNPGNARPYWSIRASRRWNSSSWVPGLKMKLRRRGAGTRCRRCRPAARRCRPPVHR